MEAERIELNAKERERLKVLHEVEEGHLKQIEAAHRLPLTDRNVRRLQVGLRQQGDGGLVHGLRGRRSNRKLPDPCQQRALRELGQARYAGFGPTLASEHLARQGVKVSRETLRGPVCGWLEHYGRPLALYTDKSGLFVPSRPVQWQEQLRGEPARTQVGRALAELDIEWIEAHSPQAKGRIERLFGTLQDRLVKEMRLREIATLEAANRFLEITFWPWWEKRFRFPALLRQDAHRQRIDWRRSSACAWPVR